MADARKAGRPDRRPSLTFARAEGQVPRVAPPAGPGPIKVAECDEAVFH